jgi:hypothetical protein
MRIKTNKLLLFAVAIFIYLILTNVDRIDQYIRYKNLPDKVENAIPDKFIPDETPFNELRFLSSHNSYHKQAGFLKLQIAKLFAPNEVEGLKYEHPPLYQQLEGGMRGFELDVRYVWGRFVTMHVPIVDNNSNSPDVILAFKEVKRWSENHPLHIPVIIIIELSREWNKYYLVQKKWDEDLLIRFDDMVFNVVKDKLIKPEDLSNEYPKLQDVRGKIAVAFMADSDIVDLFGEKYKKTRKATFIMVDGKTPGKDIVFVKRDDPFCSDIDSLVNAGYIVRTRADAELVKDSARRVRALNSQAQIISTDFPETIKTN